MSNVPIKNVHPVGSRVIVYAIYTKLIASIQHFDKIQSEYRMIASTWLLTTFAILGFLLSPAYHGIKFIYYLDIELICFLGIIFITVIACLDLLHDERLIISNIIEAAKLEKKHKWLTQYHKEMLQKIRIDKAVFRKSQFYLLSNSYLIIIAGISLAYPLYDLSVLLMSGIVALTIAALVINFLFFKRLSKKTYAASKRILNGN